MSKFDRRDPGQDDSYTQGLGRHSEAKVPEPPCLGPDDGTVFAPMAPRLTLAETDEDRLYQPFQELGLGINEWIAERRNIIAVLNAFYRAELSLSSAAPVLALAERLNPALKEGQ